MLLSRFKYHMRENSDISVRQIKQLAHARFSRQHPDSIDPDADLDLPEEGE